jgi:hypothetical protein
MTCTRNSPNRCTSSMLPGFAHSGADLIRISARTRDFSRQRRQGHSYSKLSIAVSIGKEEVARAGNGKEQENLEQRPHVLLPRIGSQVSRRSSLAASTRFDHDGRKTVVGGEVVPRARSRVV